ncbi:peptide-methionine (S)-S-oxide reductase [Segetibacter sp. 3557_3]|uniref:peptide-methionine (S)-S-oxide reductase MsrA n=1 Tax=Segetibacter sp. 3557_3 TaxID=2547429 RepID=UPI00105902A0|nr:peptide-methionine (S)-S-oxide reductase MsrA [Segetibacter sp. 3557_3]TDH26488.1 peptide-methionine (S)-S-oxide reductase [Segetibacter sp. 3557_3]
MKSIATFLIAFTMVVALDACGQRGKLPVKTKHPPAKDLKKYSQATFAAGCFWHEEAMFESIKGVKEVVSGYAGGSTKNPTYESIETGNTGHAETVNVYYDSTIITYPTLLKLYFAGQDPTQVNGQGPDRGTQYRSILFYRNAGEKKLAEDYIKALQPQYRKPIAAQLMPLTKFWEAEAYHQNYIEQNPGGGYVQMVSIPEIKKVQKAFPQLVKPEAVY